MSASRYSKPYISVRRVIVPWHAAMALPCVMRMLCRMVRNIKPSPMIDLPPINAFFFFMKQTPSSNVSSNRDAFLAHVISQCLINRKNQC